MWQLFITRKETNLPRGMVSTLACAGKEDCHASRTPPTSSHSRLLPPLAIAAQAVPRARLCWLREQRASWWQEVAGWRRCCRNFCLLSFPSGVTGLASTQMINWTVLGFGFCLACSLAAVLGTVSWIQSLWEHNAPWNWHGLNVFRGFTTIKKKFERSL